MTKKIDTKLLTDVELELMTILWRKGEGTVNDVIENLSKDRDLAYTSVSTIMRILEQKKILKTRKEGRGHIYIPVLMKEEFEKKTLLHVVDKVFEGAPSALVKQLLDSTKLSEKDLREIKELVAKMEKKT
jgi:predicted transcriptional regulator